MEENVALDSKKQKTFVKSIRGIKKLIKKNEKVGAKSEPKKKDESAATEKPFSMRLKDGKVKKSKRRHEKGLVYLSHIPHGFYEHQMTQYFKQFGVVTNARVIRSKRTGNSKGFAFVEFKEPSVAQIVAETMNNYLMGKRLIKAAYIPPEKQKRRAFRKHWNTVHNPSSISRLKLKKAFNADKDEAGDLKKARKLLSNLNKTKKKLSALGINYDFFTPVDVPQVLQDQVVKKVKEEDAVKDEKENKPKKGKKEKVEPKNIAKNEKQQNGKMNDNKANKNKKGKEDKKEVVVNKQEKKETAKSNKKEKQPVKVNEKQQKEKEKKLKDAGVKSVDEFISLDAEDSDDDDESCDFDSDEYEKMMADDDDELSSGESEGSDVESGDDDDDESGDDDDDDEENDEEDDEEDESEEEEEEIPVPPKKGKGKPPPKVNQPVQTKKQQQKQPPQKQQVKKQEPKVAVDVKRKAPQKQPVQAKKPKFEKQHQKPMKKQFKKK